MSTSTFFRFLNGTIKFSKLQSIENNVKRILKSECRTMSTNVSILKSQKEKDTFQDVLPTIIDSLVTSPKFSEVPEVTSWIKKVLDYNLTGGKKARGLTTVFAYEMLESPENVTDETMRLARILGWCVEMLQAYLLVADDMMDGSTTRRGVPCWYRLPDVGLGAINDNILIHTSLFHILKTHFGKMSQYSNIVDLFNETLMYTSIGQHLDYTMAHRNKNDYSLFTIERYNAIVKYKTAYYTYKLPVCLGLLLANNADEQTHKKAEAICLEIGEFFQIQDDFLDVYGDESVTGKAGTDIQEGKCSWFAVNALARCNPAQKTVFVTCYGSKEPAHIERIQYLYDQLGLKDLYATQEKQRYEQIIQHSRDLTRDTCLSPDLFIKLINMIYNRKM